MVLQYIHDTKGNTTGVFIPIEEWKKIKHQYPDVDDLNKYLPKWEKDFIDNRLEKIDKNPERLQPIENLFEELKRKI
jgi:hypothetical protein